jgi:acyl-homoserine-lactone acylase
MPKMRDVTLEQACQFAFETYAPAGPIWVKPLCASYDEYHHDVPDPDRSMKKMANAVRSWDYQVCKESVGATAFRYWRLEYGKLHPEAFGENEAYGAPETEEEQRDAVRALRAAADYLKSKFGAPLVPWGQLLRLRRGDLDLPLDGDVGFFGGVECMRATGTQEPGKDGRYVFKGGQVIPTVVEMTDPVQVWSIVPYGQSRRPESPHYNDQTRLYSEGQMRPAWHTWSQLRDHVESAKVFEYSETAHEL